MRLPHKTLLMQIFVRAFSSQPHSAFSPPKISPSANALRHVRKHDPPNSIFLRDQTNRLRGPILADQHIRRNAIARFQSFRGQSV
jgi:hypothetical protein